MILTNRHAINQLHTQQSLTKEGSNTVAVVDCFDKDIIDIDGDKIPDLSHGEVIFRLIKALAPQIKVEKYEVASSHNPKEAETASLTMVLNNVISDIRQGKKIAALNLSISHEGSKKALERLRQSQLKQSLLKSPHSEEQLLGQRLQLLEKLTYLGTQVYACAGNNHPQLYNRYGAAEGVRLVAHTNHEGEPLNHQSLNDPLIDSFEQGKYAITQIKDGFDLNGDNIVDIDNQEVSGRGKPVSIVSPFNGQPLLKKLGTVKDIQTLLKRGNDFLITHQGLQQEWTPQFKQRLLNHIADHPLAKTKVYRLTDLHQAGLLNDAGLRYFSRYGDYALHPAYQEKVIFRLDANNTLQYNPDNSGFKNIVTTIQGSSYAAPTAIAKEFG